MRIASRIAVAAIVALAAALFIAPREGVAQSDDRAAEQQIKAAFLYKFGSYVDWPPGAHASLDSALAIGVIGADDLAEDLARTVTGRTVNARPVAVRKLRHGQPLSGLHMLFVGRAESARLAEIVASLKGQPVLIVTESEGSLEQGSMINFVLVEDKVRFDVAPSFAERGNIRISSRLLAVARRVVASRPS